MSPTSKLEQKLAARLQTRKSASRFRQLTTSSARSVDFSSNDFLSLSHSPQLRAAFLAELQRGGHSHGRGGGGGGGGGEAAFPLGSGGSRLLDGNSAYADALEQEIARFHGAEAGLLWNSGFDANAGVFASVPQHGDVIVHDELIHASVHDGMRLSRTDAATGRVAFEHNDVASLERVLRGLVGRDEGIRRGEQSVFIAVESVYSMDGDVAPLKQIVELVERVLPLGNGHIIIDEAHGTGVLGPLGKGLVCELGLESKIFARLHTFGKSLACTGAILLCSPLVRSYLINYARPLIYTTFMSFPNLAAIKASYSLLQSGQTEPLRQHLNKMTKYFHDQLKKTVLRRNLVRDTTDTLQIPIRCPRAPIFALQTPSPRSLAGFCQEQGFVVRAVVPPTVPTRRVRICLHAGNTREQIDELVERVDQWLGMQLGNGILPSTGPGAMGQFEDSEPSLAAQSPSSSSSSSSPPTAEKKDDVDDDEFVKSLL